MKMRVHMSKGFAFCGGWGTVKGTPSWLKLGHLSRTCQVGWRWGAFRLRHYPGAALRTALGVALGVAYGLHWDCIGTALGLHWERHWAAHWELHWAPNAPHLIPLGSHWEPNAHPLSLRARRRGIFTDTDNSVPPTMPVQMQMPMHMTMPTQLPYQSPIQMQYNTQTAMPHTTMTIAKPPQSWIHLNCTPKF